MHNLHSNGAFLVVKTYVDNFAQTGIYTFKYILPGNILFHLYKNRAYSTLQLFDEPYQKQSQDIVFLWNTSIIFYVKFYLTY